MKCFFVFVVSLVMVGCANPTQDIDVKNSPCACVPYDGEPLNTTPSGDEIREVEQEWFELVG